MDEGDVIIQISQSKIQQMIDAAVENAFKKFQPAAPSETKYVSVKEAASKLKVAPLTLYRQFNKNQIPGARRIGSKIKIPNSYINQG